MIHWAEPDTWRTGRRRFQPPGWRRHRPSLRSLGIAGVARYCGALSVRARPDPSLHLGRFRLVCSVKIGAT
jgi:hypothetical protein